MHNNILKNTNGKPALMPFFTIGFPDLQTSFEIVKACVAAGADMMELGIPFSDPIADGPVIQHSSQVALELGITIKDCLQFVKQLRDDGIKIPLLLMGYLNPVIRYGMVKFLQDARDAGASGFIFPELPPNEAMEIQTFCRENELMLPFFITPNSTEERIKLVNENSLGFIYLVAVKGITGMRENFENGIREFASELKKKVDHPQVLGFGISKPAHVREAGEFADGVITGSALIKTVKESCEPVRAAGDFVRLMKGSV